MLFKEVVKLSVPSESLLINEDIVPSPLLKSYLLAIYIVVNIHVKNAVSATSIIVL